MIKETKKAPAIRFRGFTDDWERRKLGQFFFTATEKNDDGEYSQADILAASLGTELEKKHIFFGLRSTAESVKKYRKVQLGDIVYTKSPIKHYPNGIFRTCKKIPGIVPSMYCVYHKRGNIKINTSIVQCFFENKYRLDNYLRPLVNVGARNNVNITDEEVLKGTITIPINIEEQTQIVDLIENLNSLITLHQCKLDQLKTLKKYFLQNMFPAKGEKVPRIRFKGFTGDWEQRKLGEMAEIIGGGTPNTNNKSYWNGDINWYAPAEIVNQIYVNSSERKITEEGYNNSSAKMLPTGTVLFTSRAGIGKTAILAKEGCTNQGFQSIVPHKKELDSYFIFSRTEELKNYGEKMGAGSTFVEVSGKQMENMNLMMPKTIVEQQKIGTYFENIDNLITLHQRKLNQLQTMKKFMLQNLFI